MNERNKGGQDKHALVPSPKRRTDAEKEARVAGTAAENGENAGTCARAEMRDERRERAREEGAASWRTTRRTDMAVVGVTVTYIIRGPHDPTKAASAFAGWGSQNTERVTYGGIGQLSKLPG